MPGSPNSRLLRHLGGAVEGGGVTDARLLEEFVSRRDEVAFRVLVRRHGPMVLGVCRRVLRHRQDAEDALQATFLVLARKAAALGRREQLAAWLYGVAYRTALDARRRSSRQRARERQVQDVPHPTVEPEGHWPDLRPVLDEELSRLPDKYRLPLVLCDLEGRTRREVARQLGVPVGTLSNRLAAARQALARRLTRRGLALSGAGLAAALLAERSASAGPPAALVAFLVGAATRAAAGGVAAAGVPAPVASLTDGVIRAMFLSKLKTAAAVVLALCLLGTGAAGLALRATAEEQPRPKQTASPQQPPQPDEDRQRLEKELRETKAELKALRAELDKLKEQLGKAEPDRKAVPADKDGKDKQIVKVYAVGDLVSPGGVDEMIEIITDIIEPNNRLPSGASVHYFDKTKSLVIIQSALRKAKPGESKPSRP
jgi:RNA polymerase sigma factor (sigma-70 family)